MAIEAFENRNLSPLNEFTLIIGSTHLDVRFHPDRMREDLLRESRIQGIEDKVLNRLTKNPLGIRIIRGPIINPSGFSAGVNADTPELCLVIPTFEKHIENICQNLKITNQESICDVTQYLLDMIWRHEREHLLQHAGWAAEQIEQGRKPSLREKIVTHTMSLLAGIEGMTISFYLGSKLFDVKDNSANINLLGWSALIGLMVAYKTYKKFSYVDYINFPAEKLAWSRHTDSTTAQLFEIIPSFAD